MMFESANAFYGLHYRTKIAQHLTRGQKEDIAKRIGELTLQAPIWLDKNKCYKDQFPEIAPYVTESISLSGLYLCAIMGEIVASFGVVNKK